MLRNNDAVLGAGLSAGFGAGTFAVLRRLVAVVALALAAFGAPLHPAFAQEQAWLQLEAVPSLAEAENRARAYAAAFPDVAGFQTGAGWYSVVMGPFTAPEAAGRLAALKRENLIPSDSFISDGAAHGQQFWPVGAQATDPVAEPVTEPAVSEEPAPAADEAIVATEGVADESPEEARTSEAALSKEDRMALQEAMAWYGFYDAKIDGSFGKGTRKSMADWQGANGFEATGILTTAQRAALIGNFQADKAEFGFETVTEAEAGIEITLPLSLVQFDRYEPPFVHFAEKDGSRLQIILISEPGNDSTLSGLYDILQSLEIVPSEGARELNGDSFTIEARSDTVESFAFAQTERGMVKGFLAVWQPADADRMTRILPVLRASFRSVGDKALDPSLVPMEDAVRAGLIAGLEVKTPKLSRSGFYVSADGMVVTALSTVAQCGRITLDRAVDATLTYSDEALGLAVLTPAQPLAPAHFATLSSVTPRAGSKVALAGYSYADRLPAPVVSFGTWEEAQGLNGEVELARLGMNLLDGDAGGPVVDETGTVLGMALAPATDAEKVLPKGVAFALQTSAMLTALQAAGVSLPAPTLGTLPRATPDALQAQALGMTVLVGCWD